MNAAGRLRYLHRTRPCLIQLSGNLPWPETDPGRMLPYRPVSFGLDAIEQRGADASSFAAIAGARTVFG